MHLWLTPNKTLAVLGSLGKICVDDVDKHRQEDNVLPCFTLCVLAKCIERKDRLSPLESWPLNTRVLVHVEMPTLFVCSQTICETEHGPDLIVTDVLATDS